MTQDSSSSKPNTLVLIDANNLYWRAWHGLKANLSTSEGIPTWGVHGTVNSIATVIRRYEPSHVLVAFDRGVSSYRRSLYPAYKAQRPKLADDDHEKAVGQIAETEKLLRLFGFLIHSEDGVEADDIIATIVKRWSTSFDEVLIVSGDKDFAQLCEGNVKLLKPSLGGKTGKVEQMWDEAYISEQYGLPPRRLVDVWSLMGDASDNIPGVPKIGEKTALKLIQFYGTAFDVALSDEPKVAGHEHDIRVAWQLIYLSGRIADCNFPMERLLWTPVEPMKRDADRSFFQAQDELVKCLERLELTQIKDRWRGGSLWQEEPRVGRKLHLDAEAYDRGIG